MFQINRNIVAATALLAALTLTACGGGSSGSGGGSGGTKSSSVIINTSSGRAMLDPAEMDETTRVAIAISELLMRTAWAQEANVPIFFNGDPVGFTDDNGMFVQAVDPGPLEVCVGTLSNCVDLGVIEANQVVVVEGVDIVEDELVVGDVRTESSFDHLAEFQSDKPHKVYVCHKGKTLDVAGSSVGSSMSKIGHQRHGDSLGACNDFGPAVESSGPGNSGKDNKGNNGKGNENRCSKGNKPKKGCPSVNEQV